MERKIPVKTIPFRGGQNKFNEPALLPFGTFSSVQNMRQMGLGMKKRLGMIKQHSTADGTNKVLSMFQFSKGKRTERHFYAQMSDNDVLEATTAPPGVTTGVFGSEVFSGSASSLPACWGVLNDKLLFSNGVDQHQICAGTDDYIDKFIAYHSDTLLAKMPSIGTDYTDQVTDTNATTVAVLDGLGNFLATSGTVVCTATGVNFDGTDTHFLTELTVGQPVYVDASEKNIIATITSDTVATVTTAWANTHNAKTFTTSNDCLLICSQIQPNRHYFGLTDQVNANASVATVSYWNGVWVVASGQSDGTISVATKTMSGSGYITWTQPTDAIPKYMYDKNGFWTKISFNTALSASVDVKTCNFGSGFTALQDVWDGILQDAIECQFYDQSSGGYYVMGTNSVTIGAMTSSDTIVFNSYDPAEAIYIDVGNTPNVNSLTLTIKYLATDGTTWTTIAHSDGTAGLTRSGFVVLGRQASIKRMQYGSLPYESYWYQITVSATVSGTTLSDISIGLQVIPYFSISDFGIGLCSAAWKNRGVYVFDQDPAYLVISADGQPQVLSGMDSAIYKVGDGRANKVVAMRKFYNELLVAQEEKGNDGGCITLIQGTTPANLGKIVLSNSYGAMNSRCLEVVDGLVIGDKDQQTMAFILSKRGVLYTNGKTVQHVPNFYQVRNYFDPSFSECIRSGYESEMFIKHDSSFNVLIIGLVSGSSATVVNKWLVYDLGLMEFTEDSYTPALACMTEAEAASGNVPILQMGGGTADGFVYILNNSTSDVAAAIDSFVTMELSGQGIFMHSDEIILRTKVQTAGNCTITPYLNSIAQTAMTKTMTAEVANQTIRRHRFNVNLKGQHVSLKFQHNTAAQAFYLFDLTVGVEEYTDQ
jgi:hypothetical protein